MKKRTFNLGFYFSLVIFAIMAASFFIVSPLVIVAIDRGAFNSFDIVIIIIFIYIISIIVGVTISAIVGHRILKPVLKFSDAAKKVAEGDFGVVMPESSRIAELAQMAKDFNLMVRELGATETFRGDFIANLSHEFKTPLAAIEVYASLLRDADLTREEQKEYVDKILGQTGRLSALSGNILKISQLENRGIITDKKKYRLDEQLRQAILMLESKWSEKNLELDINLSDTVIYANEELLMQVWLNIIGNAVKFTPEGGKITVNLQSDGKTAEAVISDTGIGMSEDTVHRIFDKFYQADTSRKSEGNGLGLTLAERITTLCAGTIKVSSKEGEGSVFTVTLPL